MLTVLISEADSVKCSAGGVDGSKQFEHRVCKWLLPSTLGKELSEPLYHSPAGSSVDKERLLALNIDTTGEK